MKNLYEAFLEIKTESEFNALLMDLCTPSEISALNERWKIAQILYEGKLSQREIASKLNVSITTVTRVARFLNNENYKGYLTLLNRMHHHA
ncbi:MAG: trp operon repressor [Lactobacillus sp.]|jgi:Trp operon repressor|nr:trp operon repressor [Lactobacillus sp.]